MKTDNTENKKETNGYFVPLFPKARLKIQDILLDQLFLYLSKGEDKYVDYQAYTGV